MKPVVIGGIVAAVVIVAFAGGVYYQQEQKSPIEKAADSVGDAVGELGKKIDGN
ncbi:MAG: hypothetical protein ACJA1L_002163 [Paracoccaceae bacterium]|jgi:hypothetical protein